jgi:4-amino-4-deoxy-L-arabinose transferase-like glycosyltransferase
MPMKKSWAPWLILAVLWLANLPWRPLFDPDEGRYAEIPREMSASGDWVTPHLNGLKYFEKPPLQYWATAAMYSVFGVHDWTARAWAALLAFACIPLVYAFSRRIGYSTEESVIAAALLAINPYFALSGQVNLLDQGFSFFLCGAVF